MSRELTGQDSYIMKATHAYFIFYLQQKLPASVAFVFSKLSMESQQLRPSLPPP